MAILLSEVSGTLADALPHKTWTRAELAVLEPTGLLADRRYELIEGELIDKMGKKRKHVRGTLATARTLRLLFGGDHVETESPIDLAPEDNPANEPEPDIIVLRSASDTLEDTPSPADVLLVVEVSDTTLRQDLTVKARLYARAAIPEYWVLDVNTRRLHVLRNPSTGAYQTHWELHEQEHVAPLSAAAANIPVTALLP